MYTHTHIHIYTHIILPAKFPEALAWQVERERGREDAETRWGGEGRRGVEGMTGIGLAGRESHPER